MTKPVLFLDIDGVLNSLDIASRVGFGYPPETDKLSTKESLRWCPMMVARLRRIVARTDCDIVIMSSWRGYGADCRKKWQEMFACYDWPDCPVIGETPDLAQQRHQTGLYLACVRGKEVLTWLSYHPEVLFYVCLDDENQFLPSQPFVQTTIDVGLQDEQVERCIEILNHRAPET
jgi:hypothetical protein